MRAKTPQCHALGNIVATPLASQQGPDLIRVAGRVDYAFAKRWITNPKAFDPKTKMLIPVVVTPDDIDNVRMFVWKTSVEAKAAAAAGAGTAPKVAGEG
jgi:hypothetical protein